MRTLQRCGRVLTGFVLVAIASFGISSANPGQASAACAALPTDRGTVTNTVSVPATGSYRVWTRLKTATSTNNEILMQIDDTTCNIAVGGASLTANTWTWVDYQAGTTTNKFNVTLSSGNHTVVMAGKDDNVMVDRVVFTQDMSCVPTGTGDNCANPPDTTAPVVAITSPANNATIAASTQVTATASDDVAVTKVEFYLDGALVGTDTNSTYNYTITPASLTLGSHALVARAYDAAGNTANSSTLTFTVPDTTAPTVSISAPAAGSTQAGTITVSANAADNVGVSKVEFYVDGALKATDTTSTFSTSIDTTTLSNAAHSLTAKAYDAANNSTTSAAVSITVNNPVTPPADTTPPTVAISAPAAGGTVSGAYTVTATASDTSGVKQVQFFVDNVLKATDTSAPFTYSLDSTTLSNGTHAFKAVATDNSTNANVATSAVVTATVNNATFRAEDINKDGAVNLIDFSFLSGSFGKSGAAITTPRADINGDGTVNLLDFSLLSGQFGK